MKLSELVRIIREQRDYFIKKKEEAKLEEASQWYSAKIDLCESLLKIVELNK